MLALLPLLALVVLWARMLRAGVEWRAAALISALLGGLAVLGLTELLSLGYHLTRAPLAAGWGLVLVSAILWWRRTRRPAPPVPPRSLPWTGLERACLGIILLILVCTGIDAVFCAPNNWDAMTYHLPRVMHWIQNRSVAMYPAHIQRQLFMQPWAEYAVLQGVLLGGTDRWANSVQWLSMLGSLAGVSLLARQLGAPRRGQWLAAALAAVIPMGVAQASSSQTDYVASFWFICLLWCALGLVQEMRPGGRWRWWLGLGLSLGLGLATKGTLYVLAFPVLLWVGAVMLGRGWKAGRLRTQTFSAASPAAEPSHATAMPPSPRPLPEAEGKTVLQPALGLALVGLVVLGLNAGIYTRVWRAYGHPLGPAQVRARHTNQDHRPQALASVLLRTIACHFAVPLDHNRTNHLNERLMRDIHGRLGLELNDPRTTFHGSRYEVLGNSVANEDWAGSPAHVLLIFGVILLVLARWRHSAGGQLRAVAVVLTVSFLLFVVVFKWSPWNTRLELPLLVAWCAVAGVVLQQRLPTAALAVILVLAALTALPMLLMNEAKPWIGRPNMFSTSRQDQYFLTDPALGPPMHTLAATAARLAASDIGLVTHETAWEYPFWVLLKARIPRLHLEHVCTDAQRAQSAELAAWPVRRPQAVIFTDWPAGPVVLGGRRYVEVGRFAPARSAHPLFLYVPARHAPPTR